MRERALALLAGLFSTVAIIRVSVGLYGVLSYSVARRTREIGIRLALGARPLGVVLLVVSQLGVVTAIGLIVGLAGGIASSQWITKLLDEVKPSDTWSIVAPLLGLLLACALSALVQLCGQHALIRSALCGTNNQKFNFNATCRIRALF